MMTYEQFKTELHNKVQKKMGACANVKFVIVHKNNQVDLEELSCEISGRNMTPAIPLKEFYNKYLEKGMDWCVIAAVSILGTGESISKEELFQTWEAVRKKIRIELVNHAWNEELLKTVPHKDFLDFAILFRVRICETEYASAGYAVSKEMMDYWGIDMEEMSEQAFQNLYKEETFEISSLLKEISRIIGDECKEDISEDDTEDNEDDSIFVFTNRYRTKGASGMLRTDLLAEFAKEQDRDLIILPSSVHELLLVPDHGGYDIEALRDMVREINRGSVEKEEWLSSEIYVYRRKNKRVERL